MLQLDAEYFMLAVCQQYPITVLSDIPKFCAKAAADKGIRYSRLLDITVMPYANCWNVVFMFCSQYRCKDCRNHFELRKATGAVAVQFNAEAHSLVVLVSFLLC